MAEHHDIEYDDTLVTMFHEFILIDIGRGYGLNYELESIGVSILGTRMNTDYKDIKSYKKPNVCGNL